MTWAIPLRTNGFPVPLSGQFPAAFNLRSEDLLWAALTVGRPNLPAVFQHGQFSIDEAQWRISMVRANLDLNSPHVGLRHSPAFEALDPTEKGWVNFSLGMIFAKICAEKFLDIPWLVHFKWLQAQNAVGPLEGGSTPDFIGVEAGTGTHHVLEAKGRNSGFSTKVMEEAKKQASQPVVVYGQPCGMHIGTLLYREQGQWLAMAMEDPDPDARPEIELVEARTTWAEYYRTVWELHNLGREARAAFKALTGIEVKFEAKAEPMIESIISDDGNDWKQARDGLVKLSGSESDVNERKVLDMMDDWVTYPDGIRIKYSAPSPFEIASTE